MKLTRSILVAVVLALLTASSASAAPGWTGPVSIGPGFSANSVSCSSNARNCAAVGLHGLASVYDGTSWSTPTYLGTNTALTSVSCPSTTFCVAVDNSGNAFRYTGASWTSALSIDTHALNSVSCVTTNFCVAVDNSGNSRTFNGMNWSSQNGIDGTVSINAVSCVATTKCTAVDNAGKALTYNGAAWAAPFSIDTQPLTSITCPTDFCLAVDNAGNALTYPGFGSWTSPTSVDAHALTAVSCTVSVPCILVDNRGSALTFTIPTAFSTPVTVSDVSLNSVSCALSSTYCVAVDSAGNAFTYVGTNDLTVSTVGSGTVTSAPAGINCGTICSAPFTRGSAVMLTATPEPGFVFSGWSGGGCSGTGACTVTMNGSQTVSATFTAATGGGKIALGKPKLNKKKGTATLPVTVPGAGDLDVSGKDVKPLRGSTGRATKAGTVQLPIKPAGKLKKKLKTKGKASVKVTVTFTPAGGSADSATTKLKLVRRRG